MFFGLANTSTLFFDIHQTHVFEIACIGLFWRCGHFASAPVVNICFFGGNGTRSAPAREETEQRKETGERE